MVKNNRQRIAVAILSCINDNAGTAFITAQDMADRLSLSISYVEQVLAHLRRAGLVESCRGPNGGYSLGRAAAEITVGEIYQVMAPRPEQKEALKAACAALDGQINKFLFGLRLNEIM